MNPPVYFKTSVSQVHSFSGCAGTGRFEPSQSTHAAATPLNLSNSGYELQPEIGSCEGNELKVGGSVDGGGSDSNSTVGEEDEHWVKLKKSLQSMDKAKAGDVVDGLPSNCGQCACDNDSDHESIEKEVGKDLMEELVIEFCLQTYHAFKSGSLAVGLQKIEMLDKDEAEKVFEFCPNCKGDHKVKNFPNEFFTCMNLQTRKSTRNTGRSKPANYGVDNEEDDSDEEAENLKKKKRRKPIGSKSGKVITPSDKRGSTPDQLCGIKMKNGKYCSLRKPCSRHFKKVSDPNKEEKLECFPASFSNVEPVYFVPDLAEKSPEFKPMISSNSPGIKLLIKTDGLKKPITKSENYLPNCS